MVREWEWEWISSHLFVYGNLRACCFRRRRRCCRSIHCHRWVVRLVIFEKILCITTTLVIVIHSFIIKFVVCRRRLLPFAPIESSRILCVCVSFRHYHRQLMIFYFLFLFSVILSDFVNSSMRLSPPLCPFRSRLYCNSNNIYYFICKWVRTTYFLSNPKIQIEIIICVDLLICCCCCCCWKDVRSS